MASFKEKFTTKNISKWSEYIIDLIFSNKPLQGPGLLVSKKPNGYFIEVDPNGGGAGDTYAGPFTIVKKNDTTVTVKAYDGDTYLSHNYLISGVVRTEVIADQDVSISTTGVIYAEITEAASVYTIGFAFAPLLPNQTNTTYYVELYSVKFESGAIKTLNRSRDGQIEVTGRLVS